MDKNDYLKNIAGRLEFMRGHWRIAVFLIFAAFLSYIAILSINIAADMNIPPSPEEVNKKFLTVKIKKEIINEIDKFSAFKKQDLIKYSENSTERNPFSSYEASSFNVYPEPSFAPVAPAN